MTSRWFGAPPTGGSDCASLAIDSSTYRPCRIKYRLKWRQYYTFSTGLNWTQDHRHDSVIYSEWNADVFGLSRTLMSLLPVISSLGYSDQYVLHTTSLSCNHQDVEISSKYIECCMTAAVIQSIVISMCAFIWACSERMWCSDCPMRIKKASTVKVCILLWQDTEAANVRLAKVIYKF